MFRGLIVVVLAGIPAMGLVGCSTAPQTHSDRLDLKSEADRVIADAQRTDPTLRDFMLKSAGYAVFPATGEAGLLLGGGYGKGVLYERGAMTGYCDMTQATVGAQIGGKKLTEIICFETIHRVNEFKGGKYTLSAEATAVALKSGAAVNARYQNNVAVFITSQEGLMAEATVGGQKFRFTPAGSPTSTARPAGDQILGSDVENTTGYNQSGSGTSEAP
jgi:lipid-binding SYLF domain-containing protein